MEIRENHSTCVFAPLSKILDREESLRLIKNLQSEHRNIAIDLQHVNYCSLDFIEELTKITHQKKIGIFNIPSDIFVLFNVMGFDKAANLFVNEIDFSENKRQLINRKFSLV